VVATQPPAIVAPARLPALHGEVLAIDRVTGRVLVRHAPFEGMPAMTMSFRLASGAPALHVGDAVRGLVDEHTDPWTLRDVHVVRAPSAAKPQPFVPVLREGDMVPATALVDEHGRPFSLQSSDGRTTIVSFIYTRCRDASMCPLVSAKFARMQRAIGTAPIRLLLLTLDPSYDTPAVLARYGAAYGADPRRWTFATGEPDAVENLAARLGINATRPVPGVVVHDEAALIIDPSGRIARIVTGATWLPDDLLANARHVAGAGDDPLRRLRLWLGASASALCGAAGGTTLTVGAALALLAALIASFTLIARRAFRT
jgi:protein SCO1/2